MFKTILIGRIGAQAKLNATVPVSNFSVACDYMVGQDKKTQWVNCALFGKRAQGLNNYLDKGVQVYIEGTMSIDTYNKDNPQLKCVVQDLQMLSWPEKRDTQKVQGDFDDKKYGNDEDFPY